MKNKKTIIFISLITVVLLAIGVTLAYYTSSDTFNNEFVTGNYSIETQESFVSPSNWTPGTTTPKTVIATNKGNTPAAVRIKLTPSWQDKDGNPLPLSDGTNDAAIINFASNLNSKWIYQDGYYYYNRALKENKSTTSLIESVTFNPDLAIDTSSDCDTVNGVTTCTTTFNDYAGGKYTLQIEVETAQFDQYKNIWGTTVDIQENPLRVGTLMLHNNNSSTTFGKSINRSNFESITMVDGKSVPSNAIDSWDVSTEKNRSVMAWYTDVDQDSKYELYIGQDDGVNANPNSVYLFSGFKNVEVIDVTNLDISNVTGMWYMFSNLGSNATTCSIVGISDWDTSNVINMGGMFSGTCNYSTTFNIGDLSNWDTSQVLEMSNMFSNLGSNATTWSIGDISGWDTSSVTNMSFMFDNTAGSATTWNIGDLSEWDTRKVTKMDYMFSYTARSATTFDIGDISGWDTSSVTSMSSMFNYAGYSATTFDIGDLSGWDVSKVTTMGFMFHNAGYNATTFKLDLSGWKSSSVANFGSMFDGAGYNATTFDLGDLSEWVTPNATTMAGMFLNTGHTATTFDLGDLSDWDTSGVKSMQDMFKNAGYNATTWYVGDLSNWNTSKVTTMGSMFEGAGHTATTFKLNLSSWDISEVTNMTSMFEGAGYNSATWNIGDLSNWDTSKASMVYMFTNAGYNATTWNSIGTLKVYAFNIRGIFYDCRNAKATLNIYNNTSTYLNAFNNAATVSGSGITVNYTSSVTNIDSLISTKSTGSNVVKGSVLS